MVDLAAGRVSALMAATVPYMPAAFAAASFRHCWVTIPSPPKKGALAPKTEVICERTTQALFESVPPTYMASAPAFFALFRNERKSLVEVGS